MQKAIMFLAYLFFCAAVSSIQPAVAQTHNFWTSGAAMPTALKA